jgi:hypothetical protein
MRKAELQAGHGILVYHLVSVYNQTYDEGDDGGGYGVLYTGKQSDEGDATGSSAGLFQNLFVTLEKVLPWPVTVYIIIRYLIGKESQEYNCGREHACTGCPCVNAGSRECTGVVPRYHQLLQLERPSFCMAHEIAY